MNTRDIEYYVQLVKLKNFTKVANLFHVSQPTITYAVQRLEKELNAVLIVRDRSHNELLITPAGHQLFIHAQSILQEITRAKAEIQQLQTKKFVLACHQSLEMNIFQNYPVTSLGKS